MFYICIFIFGLLVGSFLNVVIFRAPKKQSFLRGRSKCPKCQKKLNWYELIPVLSFLFLGGKCSRCEAKISWQYPLVELLVGILFLLSGSYFIKFIEADICQWNFFVIFNFIFLMYIASVLFLTFIYDLKYYIILNKVVYPSILISLAALALNTFYFKNTLLFPYLCSGLIGASIGGGFFFTLILISRGRWMGMGDAKLAVFMGLILGWDKMLCALLLAFVSGAIVGISLILLGKKKMKSEIPFGTFLSLASFISLLYGTQIINWYLNLILF